MIKTNRLKIYPASIDEMISIIKEEKDEELKKAYNEMLDGCLNYKDDYLWHTLWLMELKNTDKKIIGNLSFKGIDKNGIVEIGYLTNKEFENKGYMTESLSALVKWASIQPKVKRIEAEAEERNLASIKVLKKCNFVKTGEVGSEGIRFVYIDNKGGKK